MWNRKQTLRARDTRNVSKWDGAIWDTPFCLLRVFEREKWIRVKCTPDDVADGSKPTTKNKCELKNTSIDGRVSVLRVLFFRHFLLKTRLIFPFLLRYFLSIIDFLSCWQLCSPSSNYDDELEGIYHTPNQVSNLSLFLDLSISTGVMLIFVDLCNVGQLVLLSDLRQQFSSMCSLRVSLLSSESLW